MTKINLSRRVMDVLHQSGYKNEYFISDFEYFEIENCNNKLNITS